MRCYLLKFVKIFICTILMVAILSVTCFATNEGLYGHYVSAGTYRFNDELSNPGYNISIPFDFQTNPSDGIFYSGLLFDGTMIYYWGGNASNNNGPVYSNDSWVTAYQVIEVSESFYIYDSASFSWWIANTTRVDSGYDSSFFDEVVSIFTFVGQWISGAAEDLTVMFWADNSLTFVGTLAVASLAMAVSFLIIGLISRFLRFRG